MERPRDQPTPSGRPGPPAVSRSIPLDDTAHLIDRVRSGDAAALNILYERYVPRLRQLLRGRLPVTARGMLETQDLVQEAVMASLASLDTFEVRHPGAFLGYLFRTATNRIIDEVRKTGRRPARAELSDALQALDPSPLQIAMGREQFTRYDEALTRLTVAEQELVVCRFELQLEYQDIAAITGKPTANAARSAVKRALKRLVENMDDKG